MTSAHRQLESTMLGIAFALLLFGIPDGPLSLKDVIASGIIGLLLISRPL